jgi:hypothetical protein
MRHAWEDLWLFVLLALTILCVLFDRPRAALQRLRARWVLLTNDRCQKHGKKKWYYHGCEDCCEEKRQNRAAHAAKRTMRIQAAKKVLGL